jgi:hypothetical protein
VDRRLVLHENESKPGHGLTRIYTDQGGALSEAEGRINLFWFNPKACIGLIRRDPWHPWHEKRKTNQNRDTD